jgi:hypothetical protein
MLLQSSNKSHHNMTQGKSDEPTTENKKPDNFIKLELKAMMWIIKRYLSLFICHIIAIINCE